jgi:hypothetical protein
VLSTYLPVDEAAQCVVQIRAGESLLRFESKVRSISKAGSPQWKRHRHRRKRCGCWGAELREDLMLPFLPVALLSLFLLLEWRSAWRRGRLGREEELAHARALARRKSSSEDRPRERRKEGRHAVSATSVTASVLGEERVAMGCRILDISRSGMRIALSQPLPPNAQVSVAWGNECFVGTSCYSFAQGDEYVLGLRMTASTCCALGFLSDVRYQWNELRRHVRNSASIWGASNYRPQSPVALVLQAVERRLLFVLRQFAVMVLGAEMRPRQH